MGCSLNMPATPGAESVQNKSAVPLGSAWPAFPGVLLGVELLSGPRESRSPAGARQGAPGSGAPPSGPRPSRKGLQSKKPRGGADPAPPPPRPGAIGQAACQSRGLSRRGGPATSSSGRRDFCARPGLIWPWRGVQADPSPPPQGELLGPAGGCRARAACGAALQSWGSWGV